MQYGLGDDGEDRLKSESVIQSRIHSNINSVHNSTTNSTVTSPRHSQTHDDYDDYDDNDDDDDNSNIVSAGGDGNTMNANTNHKLGLVRGSLLKLKKQRRRKSKKMTDKGKRKGKEKGKGKGNLVELDDGPLSRQWWSILASLRDKDKAEGKVENPSDKESLNIVNKV
jgi:hypothetical protein